MFKTAQPSKVEAQELIFDESDVEEPQIAIPVITTEHNSFEYDDEEQKSMDFQPQQSQSDAEVSSDGMGDTEEFAPGTLIQYTKLEDDPLRRQSIQSVMRSQNFMTIMAKQSAEVTEERQESNPVLTEQFCSESLKEEEEEESKYMDGALYQFSQADNTLKQEYFTDEDDDDVDQEFTDSFLPYNAQTVKSFAEDLSDIDEIPQTVPMMDDGSLPDQRILRQTEMNPLDEGDVSQARFESPKRIKKVPNERRFILETPSSSDDGACEVASDDEDLKKVNLSESVKPRESSHQKFSEKKDPSYEFQNSSGEEFVPQPNIPGLKSTALQTLELSKPRLNFVSPKAQSTNALPEPLKQTKRASTPVLQQPQVLGPLKVLLPHNTAQLTSLQITCQQASVFRVVLCDPQTKQIRDVTRTMKHFYLLKACLILKFPGLYVPSLPQKRNQTEQFRIFCLTRFIKQLHQCSYLAASCEVQRMFSPEWTDNYLSVKMSEYQKTSAWFLTQLNPYYQLTQENPQYALNQAKKDLKTFQSRLKNHQAFLQRQIDLLQEKESKWNQNRLALGTLTGFLYEYESLSAKAYAPNLNLYLGRQSQEKANQKLFESDDTKHLRQSFDRLLQTANPFAQLLQWHQYQLSECETLQDCVTVVWQIEKQLTQLKSRIAADQIELAKLQLGAATLKSFWLSKEACQGKIQMIMRDLPEMAKQAQQMERHLVTLALYQSLVLVPLISRSLYRDFYANVVSKMLNQELQGCQHTSQVFQDVCKVNSKLIQDNCTYWRQQEESFRTVNFQ